jgi:hypothetical protein
VWAHLGLSSVGCCLALSSPHHTDSSRTYIDWFLSASLRCPIWIAMRVNCLLSVYRTAATRVVSSTYTRADVLSDCVQ